MCAFFRNVAADSTMDQADVASQFMSLTNCTNTEASFYLEAANYDLDRAVAMFFGEQQVSRCQLMHDACKRQIRIIELLFTSVWNISNLLMSVTNLQTSHHKAYSTGLLLSQPLKEPLRPMPPLCKLCTGAGDSKEAF